MKTVGDLPLPKRIVVVTGGGSGKTSPALHTIHFNYFLLLYSVPWR